MTSETKPFPPPLLTTEQQWALYHIAVEHNDDALARKLLIDLQRSGPPPPAPGEVPSKCPGCRQEFA
jgi:hypothetical protein